MSQSRGEKMLSRQCAVTFMEVLSLFSCRSLTMVSLVLNLDDIRRLRGFITVVDGASTSDPSLPSFSIASTCLLSLLKGAIFGPEDRRL